MGKDPHYLAAAQEDQNQVLERFLEDQNVSPEHLLAELAAVCCLKQSCSAICRTSCSMLMLLCTMQLPGGSVNGSNAEAREAAPGPAGDIAEAAYVAINKVRTSFYIRAACMHQSSIVRPPDW